MTIDEVQSATALQNALPGACLPYYLAAGEGLRYELGGQLVTVIARPEDTGGQFGAAYVYGARGTETEFLSHDEEHWFIYLTDGALQIWLPDETHTLVPGDSVTIPPGTPYAYRMLAHRTRFLSWLTGGGHRWAQTAGRPTDAHVYDTGTSTLEQSETAERFGIRPHDLEKPAITATELPAGATPYVLRAGEGDRLAGQDQLNTFLARPRNTDATYFAVHTIGSKSPYIPRHFHREHTENFFCLEGRILLHVNGEELLLTKGDFVHAPAGTVHSFAFDSHTTQMLGLLTTGVFEKFFDYMHTPTDAHVHAEGADVGFPVEAFARARAELDLEVVGPPPVRGG
ncbi:quercetin 2,3-dioxygenase [Mycolicibacterium bacteremicum]|uniref:quercetin 2,3-dioxygenase n=1 Tax=Mycolicibacterium bacteremicum TaxID=564198 RepID=UPI0026EBE400|nr:quercetin 2,3-dioxygenase [Mycolicibacterium bacteremicum]